VTIIQASNIWDDYGAEGSPPSFEQGVETLFQLYQDPVDACDFVQAEHFPTNFKMWNTYSNGSFLIWYLKDYKVFISSETFVYFGPILDSYVKVQEFPESWRPLMSPYNPDFAIINTADKQARVFLYSSQWALVYLNQLPKSDRSVNMVFVRRRPDTQALIARCRVDCPLVKDFSPYQIPAAQ
jgi:hypothetical protein